MPDTAHAPGDLYRYRFETGLFDEAAMELFVDGAPVRLEPKPLQLLAELVRRTGEVVAREELLDAVWPEAEVGLETLTTAVSKLRKALGPELKDRIVTQHGVGYRFKGPVTREATGQVRTPAGPLKAGDEVPGRPGFVLKDLLSEKNHRQVWRARHDKTGQDLVFKFAVDAEGLRSLKREWTVNRALQAQLGARRDFVRLLNANFSEPPYFVESEYGGADLLAWSMQPDSLSAMELPARLALVRQIADAVAAAHGASVLHRDLKPTNILVEPDTTGEGLQVRLVDFGSGDLIDPDRLARMDITPLGVTIDESDHARTALTTPLYAAPEIIEGQPATARSDVYALGILLYQIVAGNLLKPLASGWERDIADPILRGDIRKATAGDPALRLQSAELVAERLHTLDARRAEAEAAEAERLKQAERDELLKRVEARRPWILATGAALAAGCALGLVLFLRADAAREVAETEARRAEAARAFLGDILESADPRTAGVGPDATVRDALARASVSLDQRFASDPDIRIELLGDIADIQRGLSDFDGQARTLARMIEVLTAEFGAAADPTLVRRYQEARSRLTFLPVDEMAGRIAAIDADAGDLDAASPQVRFAAYAAKGELKRLSLDFAGAIPLLDAALAAHDEMAEPAPRTAFNLTAILAESHGRVGAPAAGLEVLQRLDAPPFSDDGVIPEWMRVRARMIRGNLLFFSEDHEAARPLLEAAVAETLAIYGEDAFDTAQVRMALGHLYSATGEKAKAVEVYEKAVPAACAHTGNGSQSCLFARANLGILSRQLGRPESALVELAAAREGVAALAGADAPSVQLLDFNIAHAFLDLGRVEEARALRPGLDPEVIRNAAPDDNWTTYLEALDARIAMGSGARAEGERTLERLAGVLREAGIDPAEIAAMTGPVPG